MNEEIMEDWHALEGAPAMMTYTEASKFLKMSVGKLCILVQNEQIPHYRLGPRTIRFAKVGLERWLRDRAIG